jgi:predicted  nucleic acid-binding Zn-ribbon protein
MCLTFFAVSEMQNLAPGRISLPTWLFWIFLLLIVVLTVLLFVRDKALRKGVAGLISRTKNKIEKSRIQARIKRQEKDLDEALLELGDKSWRLQIETHGMDETRQSLEALDEETRKLTGEKEQIDAEQAKLNKAHDAFVKSQDEKTGEQELKKKPHADKLHLLRSDLSKVDKDLQKSQKDIQKLEAQIKSVSKDLEKIGSDTKLSDTEKKVKKDVLDGDLKNWHGEIDSLQEKTPSLEEALNKYSSQIKDEEKTVAEFEAILKALEEDKKEAQHKYDQETGTLKKKSAEINKNLDELDRRRKPLLKKVGDAVNSSRPDNAELTVFYSRIDSLKASLQTMKEELQRISG